MNVQPTTCPVCDCQNAQFSGRAAFDGEEVKCPRCGHFKIRRNLLVLFNQGQDSRETTLRKYLPAYTRQALEPPLLNQDNWELFAQLHSTTRVPDKADKLLRLCGKRTNVAGEPFKLNIDLDYPLVDAAASSEMNYLFRYLIVSGYIEGDAKVVETTPVAWLTVKGWQKLEIPLGGVAGRCFVAMWFDKSLDEAYKGIEAAIITDCDLPRPIRMDLEEDNDKICDKILGSVF